MINENEVDLVGLEEFKKLAARVGDRWRVGTLEVLRQRNPELIQKMEALETQIDSLLLITPKPKELKKRYADLLEQYEQTINMAIAYADRHLSQAQTS